MADSDKGSPARRIPPIDRLLGRAEVRAAVDEVGDAYGGELLRRLVDEIRAAAVAGKLAAGALEDRLERLPEELRRRAGDAARPGLASLLNATGVVVHTNLGRAPLSVAARRRVDAAAAGFVDLEYDLATGRRGKRTGRVHDLLADLLPGRAFHVVNNNAAALLLILNTLAEGKEVVVSRGELVEIGGSFRLPEILAKSGARLREIGTTNRTRLADYEAALGPATGLLLRVHASNFRIVGFTEAAPTAALAELARDHGVPLVVDEGAGNLHDLSVVGVADEPAVGEILAAGADVVSFSGDKLLGGPQAGLVVGREDLIQAMRDNPMSRALRVDKMTLAALEATLIAHRRGRHADELPVQKMIALTGEQLRGRAERIAAAIRKGVKKGAEVAVEPGESVIGGGAAPARGLPTHLVTLRPADRSVDRLAADLRAAEPPVVARVANEAVVLDPRTIPAESDDLLVAAVIGLYRGLFRR